MLTCAIPNNMTSIHGIPQAKITALMANQGEFEGIRLLSAASVAAALEKTRVDKEVSMDMICGFTQGGFCNFDGLAGPYVRSRHARTRAHTHAYVHTHVLRYERIRTHMHARTHARTHAHTHTHTHSCLSVSQYSLKAS